MHCSFQRTAAVKKLSSRLRAGLCEGAKLQGVWVNMSWMDSFRGLKQPEHRLAWLIALAADAIQIIGFPMFAEGAVSPADSLLDLVVAVVLVRLLGWHWAFLPSLAAELIPGMDLFPTWTAAVWYVTRQRVASAAPQILPPGPAPERRQ